MLKVLFLILIVMSFAAFGQKQEKSEAYKFFESGRISNRLLKEKTEDFFQVIKKESGIQGLIVNYGSRKEIAKREKQIRESINFRDPDVWRIAFFTGENRNPPKTVFWIVPAGAKFPIRSVGNKVIL